MTPLTPYSPLDFTDPCRQCGNAGQGSHRVKYESFGHLLRGRPVFDRWLRYTCNRCGAGFDTATKAETEAAA